MNYFFGRGHCSTLSWNTFFCANQSIISIYFFHFHHLSINISRYSCLNLVSHFELWNSNCIHFRNLTTTDTLAIINGFKNEELIYLDILRNFDQAFVKYSKQVSFSEFQTCVTHCENNLLCNISVTTISKYRMLLPSLPHSENLVNSRKLQVSYIVVNLLLHL